MKIENLDNRICFLKFKTYPEYPFFNILTEKSIMKSFYDNNINDKYIIHTRTELYGRFSYNAYLKLHKSKSNMLVDIRGSAMEEIILYGKMNFFLKKIKLFRYKKKMELFLNNVKYINTVSKELKTYVKDNFNVKSKYISVIPTIASKLFIYNEDERNKLRKKLNINENEILFVFSSGSSQDWQGDDEIVNALISKGYKILMLTKKKYNHENIISKFVPHIEVASYLNAADIGIIIRNDDTVNNVASPIKFSEYLSCGLPIWSNNSVGIITEILKENDCGSLNDLKNIENKIVNSLISLDRNKISKIGIKHFGIENIVNMYIKTYTDMIKG